MGEIKARSFRGSVLREARNARGLSQSALGSLIGAHVTSVSDWERGDNAPSGRHVASLARELNVAVDRFYADEDDEEAARTTSQPPELLEALYAELAIALGKPNSKGRNREALPYD